MSEESKDTAKTGKKKPVKKAPAKKRTTASAAKKTTAKASTRKTTPATKAKKASTPRKSTAKKTTPKARTTSKPDSKSAATATEKAQTSETIVESTMETHENNSNRDQQNRYDTHEDSHTAERLKQELKDKDWGAVVVRGVFMLMFGFLAWIAISASFVLAGMQFIILILTGGPNELIRQIIMLLGRYIVDVMQYLSFESDERPFPLGKDLPDMD